MSDTADLENLADMSDERLLAGLEEGTIPPADFAAEFRRREFRYIEDELDRDCIEEARAHYRRREYRETLWNLEKALGPEFAGLSDIIPESGWPGPERAGQTGEQLK